MKYIILLLLSFNLQAADIYIQRSPVTEQTGAGYMFAFQENGIMRCWTMPDMLDINYVPPSWIKVTEAATAYNWPFAEGVLATTCQNGPAVPRTIGGTLYTINHMMRVQPIGSVPAGVPCGDKIMYINYLRAVTYNGQYGFAACS